MQVMRWNWKEGCLARSVGAYAFKPCQNSIGVVPVDSKSKSYLAIAMGIVILLADIYWLAVGNSYAYPPWLAAGIIIFVADLLWLWVDYDLMRK